MVNVLTNPNFDDIDDDNNEVPGWAVDIKGWGFIAEDGQWGPGSLFLGYADVGVVAGPEDEPFTPAPGTELTASVYARTIGGQNTLRIQIGRDPQAAPADVLAEADIPRTAGVVTCTAEVPADYDGTRPVYFVVRQFDPHGNGEVAIKEPVLDAPDPEPDPPEPDPDPDPDPPAPDPDPEDPDPWDVFDALAKRLAPRVAAFIGRVGDAPTIATAEAQLPVVIEYVRGYTRGRGFNGEIPNGALCSVIVSATARLAGNPEQVSYYSAGDYSERPAVLAGWTLAELAVLRRYRRTAA